MKVQRGEMRRCSRGNDVGYSNIINVTGTRRDAKIAATNLRRLDEKAIPRKPTVSFRLPAPEPKHVVLNARGC